jgi:hypothetical protein
MIPHTSVMLSTVMTPETIWKIVVSVEILAILLASIVAGLSLIITLGLKAFTGANKKSP